MFKLIILLFLYSCSSFNKKEKSFIYFPHMADIYQGTSELDAKLSTQGFKLNNEQMLVIHTQFNSKEISVYVMPINLKTFNKKEYITIPKYSFFKEIDKEGNFSTDNELFFPSDVSDYLLVSDNKINSYLIYFPKTINIYNEIKGKSLTN